MAVLRDGGTSATTGIGHFCCAVFYLFIYYNMICLNKNTGLVLSEVSLSVITT